MLGAVVDGVVWLELDEAPGCWLMSGLLLEGEVPVEDGDVEDGVVLVWDD